MQLLVAAIWMIGGVLAQQPGPEARGRQIYSEQRCSMCHQIAGQGNKMFPLDGVGARLSDTELRRWFTDTAEMENARPKRPAIRMSSRGYDFSDADLDALVAYLKTLK